LTPVKKVRGRIIYLTGFTDEDKIGFKTAIHSNTITSMSALVRSLSSEQISELSDEDQRNAELLSSPETLTLNELTPQLSSAIISLWNTKVIRDRFENKSNIQIIDSASYFFDRCQAISDIAYVPTIEDILYSRVRTTGISEIVFTLGGSKIRLIDVGGQRSERRKWIHCFEEVTALFFIVAISEYDQFLREDQTSNRLTESINLFREVCNYKCFETSPIILFLNKSDIFKNKVEKVRIATYFPEFEGPNTFEAGVEFMKKKN